MSKCTLNTATERPNSRANGADAPTCRSCRRRREREVHTRMHYHAHTYALSFVSSFARSVGRSPLARPYTRTGHTRVVFVFGAARQRWADDARTMSDDRFAPRRLVSTWTRGGCEFRETRARQTGKKTYRGTPCLPSCHKALTANRNTWLRRDLCRDRHCSFAVVHARCQARAVGARLQRHVIIPRTGAKCGFRSRIDLELHLKIYTTCESTIFNIYIISI